MKLSTRTQQQIHDDFIADGYTPCYHNGRIIGYSKKGVPHENDENFPNEPSNTGYGYFEGEWHGNE